MKEYIKPTTITVSMISGFVCAVNSVQGNGPGFGGEDNTIDPG